MILEILIGSAIGLWAANNDSKSESSSSDDNPSSSYDGGSGGDSHYNDCYDYDPSSITGSSDDYPY